MRRVRDLSLAPSRGGPTGREHYRTCRRGPNAPRAPGAVPDLRVARSTRTAAVWHRQAMSPGDSLDPGSRADRAASFEHGAAQYASTRPSYPDAAVDWLVPDGAHRVLDLAAGTGKLTERLVARGLDVVAVEPSDAMRDRLAETVPDAEALPDRRRPSRCRTRASTPCWSPRRGTGSLRCPAGDRARAAARRPARHRVERPGQLGGLGGPVHRDHPPGRHARAQLPGARALRAPLHDARAPHGAVGRPGHHVLAAPARRVAQLPPDPPAGAARGAAGRDRPARRDPPDLAGRTEVDLPTSPSAGAPTCVPTHRAQHERRSARDTTTGDDVRVAVRWLADRLAGQPVSAFDAQAGPVRWSCWTTTEHVVDDLLAYALQLAALPALAYVPLVGPKGEGEIAHVDRAAGTAGLVEALVGGGSCSRRSPRRGPRTRAPSTRTGSRTPTASRRWGSSRSSCTATTCSSGSRTHRARSPGLAARALARLFPDVETSPDEDPDAVLLWATGRGELPGRPRRTRWRWDATVRADAPG